MKGQIRSVLVGKDFDNDFSGAITILLNNNTVIAERGLAQINFYDRRGTVEHHWAQFGIIQVVTEKGPENFDPPYRFIYRHGVKTITFYVEVYRAEAMGRALVHIWS